MCCKQSFITKGFFKRHDKNRGFPSLSLKRANIQLAGIYLADNHIRSPFAFAYIFCWQIIVGIISLLFCFVNRFSALFLITPPSRNYPNWRLNSLSVVSEICIYLLVDLPDFFLHSKVSNEPDEEINNEEDRNIDHYTPNGMRYPVHTISDRKRWNRYYNEMQNSLLQKAPFFNFIVFST